MAPVPLPIPPPIPIPHPIRGSQGVKGPTDSHAGFGSGSGVGQPRANVPPTTMEVTRDDMMEDTREDTAPITTQDTNIVGKEGNIVDDDTDDDEEEEYVPPPDTFQGKVYLLVESDGFGSFIMAMIGLNTVLMAMEHHGQSAFFISVQFMGNIFFAIIFAIEMILKLMGLGLFIYVQDRMNVFDAFIVVASTVELVSGGGGALSVLRTFRLMRIFKLVRFMPGLRRQMIVILGSLAEVSNFCLILLLFMFIYSILGMFLFGAKLEGRSHFNNLYRSFVTVFQMLTIEDWPGVMFDAVSATDFSSTVYFMSLLVSGNYILTNLFVAILLEACDAALGMHVALLYDEHCSESLYKPN